MDDTDKIRLLAKENLRLANLSAEAISKVHELAKATADIMVKIERDEINQDDKLTFSKVVECCLSFSKQVDTNPIIIDIENS